MSLRNKVCNGPSPFQGAWLLWYRVFPKNGYSKTFVSFSRFGNCLKQGRSSFSSQDMAKKVIVSHNWSPMLDHSAIAVKEKTQITQFGSELSRMSLIGTVWGLESKIGPHFLNFMPFFVIFRDCTPPLPAIELIGFWEIKCATNPAPSKGLGSFGIEFRPKYPLFKNVGQLLTFPKLSWTSP